MAGPQAFISYRRNDEFVRGAQGAIRDLTFIENLKTALLQSGFTDVFVDTSAIQVGEHYESRIHRAISECDLFIAVIGRKWLELLREKVTSGERDVLVREIRAALTLEKEIAPMLVDGATMPRAEDLPRQISSFHFQNSVAISSRDSVHAIAAALSVPMSNAAHVRKLGRRWTRIYWIAAVFAYYFCALQTHLIGLWEFGAGPWFGMAKVWSGFYIWPMIFLPFTLIALYRPLTVLCESAFNTTRWKDRLTYLTPLTLGTVMTILAVAIEVFPREEVPWSIHPVLPGCQQSAAEQPADHHTLLSYNMPNANGGPLGSAFAGRFWLKDKCWPNVFFYLTVPAYTGQATEAYWKERENIQRAFMRVLRGETNTPYSASFFPYVLSFTILIWIACVGIFMAALYVTVSIRRPFDEKVLKLPTEDAYLCLTYCFVTLMIWVPFRMNTNFVKYLYFCEKAGCSVGVDHYLNDVFLGTMFLIGYIFITGGLLIKYRRVALGFLGTASIAAIIGCAYLVFHFQADIARLTDLWQFYVGISIPSILIFAALWYQFDPAIVRFNDFRKEIE